jgi:hypothetical protein
LTTVTQIRVKLYPTDFERVRDYYAETLGWPVSYQWNHGSDNRGVMFESGSGIIELLPSKGQAVPVQGCDLSLRVADVWKLWQELQDRVPVVFALRQNPWGDDSFCVADPKASS